MSTITPAVTRRAGLLAVLAGLVAVMFSVALATPASAHARLLTTDPADGSVVPAAPDRITLTFSEPVRPGDDAVRVLDPTGAELEVTARAVDEQVVAEVPPELPDGTYVVSWRVVSADTHPVTGGFTFTVGAPGDDAAEPASAPDSGEDRAVAIATVGAQGAGYLGLLAAAGLVVFQMVLLPAGQRSPDLTRRLRAPALAAAVVAVATLLVLLPLTTARQTGAGLGALVDPGAWREQLTTDPGLTGWLAAGGLTVGLMFARRSRPGRVSAALALTGVAMALASLALVGHTRTFEPRWLVVSSDLLHVSCAAVWFGGLLGLWLVLRDAEPAPAAAAVARFSSVAAVLVSALAVAGVVLGWRILGSWAALFGTTYGVTLLIKVGLAAAVMSVAAYNRFRLLPRMARAPSWPTLRRTVGIEASGLVVILALTGLLVEQNPREESAAPPSGPVTVQSELGDAHVDLRLAPGRPGGNTLTLHLTDAAGEPLVPLRPPHVRLSLPDADLGPFEGEVSETRPGSYEAAVDLPLAGEWIAEISVRISQFDEPVARFPVDVR